MKCKLTLKESKSNLITHTRKNQGVTLIALAVTIIVMLIIAGATVSVLTGKNGIMKQSITAKEKNAIKQAEEIAQLEYSNLKMKKEIENADNEITIEEIVDKLKKEKYEIKQVFFGDATGIRLSSNMILIKPNDTIELNVTLMGNNNAYYIIINKRYYEIKLESDGVKINTEYTKNLIEEDISKKLKIYTTNNEKIKVDMDKNKIKISLKNVDNNTIGIIGRVNVQYTDGKNNFFKSCRVKVTQQINWEEGDISKEQSYVGCYADIDGDGNVEGIIYADLIFGGNDYYLNKFQKISTEDAKEYKISKKNYTDIQFREEKKVISFSNSSGKDRFYIIALEDFEDDDNNSRFYWYKNAYENKIYDYSLLKDVTTSYFGDGRNNTRNMIEKWENSEYGEKDSLDIWGKIKKQYFDGWFIPSGSENTEFYRALNINSSNYREKGFYNIWSSSRDYSFGADSACVTYFETSSGAWADINWKYAVRLNKVF